MKSAQLKRMGSKKSHSWWWDSHITPKNSKWLIENLEDMDQHVKQMLKLLEEDGDSFSKKVEIYYQRRPEVIDIVEKLYRMYRSLAERYDNVAGELRKTVSSDLNSQSSGLSDVGPELPVVVPSAGIRQSHRKPVPRAAGFDFFLGSASDLYCKEGDESSTLDSETESEDSSVNNYSSANCTDEEHGLRKKIVELEAELREAKEKLQMPQEVINDPFFKISGDENSEIPTKIAAYEEELRRAKEHIHRSEGEITHMKNELEKYKSLGESNNLVPEYQLKQDDPEALESVREGEQIQFDDFQGSMNCQSSNLEKTIQMLELELGITNEKLHSSEEIITSLRGELTSKDGTAHNLQHQLESLTREVSCWKNKFEKEKSEVTKLLDRIVRYKYSLSDRDQEIRGLKEVISSANKSLSEENEQLKSEITRMSKERRYLDDNLKEMDHRCQLLEEDVRRVKSQKAEMQVLVDAQLQQLKADVAERNAIIDELNKDIDAFMHKHDMVSAERDILSANIAELMEDTRSKDEQIIETNVIRHKLEVKNNELLSALNTACDTAKELRSKVKALEAEVNRQHEIIVEEAEGKREAIRQLCLSLEHYRDGYHQLQHAAGRHK